MLDAGQKIKALEKDFTKAIEEVKAMKKNPSLGKTYTDVDDMMKELLN